VTLYVTLADLLRMSASELARVEALGFYRAALVSRPRSPELLNRIAACLTDHLDRPAEGAEYFREVIRLRPDYWMARMNLSIALGRQGRHAEAEVAAREAVAVAPNARTYLQLGRVLDRLGRQDAATAAFRDCVRSEAHTAEEHYARAVALGFLGQAAEAVAAYRAAAELRPQHPQTRYGLAAQLATLDKPEEAVTAYREAIRLRPTYAEAHCNLGHQLLRVGQYADALASLRRGHELGSKIPNWAYPSGKWVERAERLIAIEWRLPAFISGNETPSEREDTLAVAFLVRKQKRYVRTAELYRAALADPIPTTDKGANDRYTAACCAALAGCGKGEDATRLDDAGRAGWRRQALEWLQAELATHQKQLADHPTTARREVQGKLRDWQKDDDLNGVRSASELAKLPEADATAWARFWADVQSTLDKASPPAKED
jgi:Flp pilus assembly protein TadD